MRIDNPPMHHDPYADVATRLTPLWRDVGIVVAVVVAFAAVAMTWELSERLVAFVHRYESVQADEIMLTLLVLSLCLVWFAVQRAREAKRALAQRMAAQAQISALLAHNRDLAQRLIVVQEEERRALARELHDEVGQNCTAIRAEASFISHAHSAPTVMASAQRIEQAAAQLYAITQSMLTRLRPSALDSLGLSAALQELCEAWETQTGITCAFFPYGVPATLDDATSIALFRLVQEALTNVTRHAQATQVNIGLQATDYPTYITLKVVDDGVGLAHPDGPHAGFGLSGMRERVAALHGHIAFGSGKSVSGEAVRGFQITVELPLPPMDSVVGSML